MAWMPIAASGCTSGLDQLQAREPDRTRPTTTSTPETATTTTSPAESESTTTSVPPSSTTGPPVAGDPGAAGLGDEYFPEEGNGGYDVTDYDLTFVVGDELDHLIGSTIITANPTTTLSSFNVDFSGFEVTTVTVDGRTAGFTRAGQEMTIRPDHPLTPGTAFVVRIDYGGVAEPVADDTSIGVMLGWLVEDGTSYTLQEPDAADHWFPCNDHPSDKAAFTFRVTAPGQYKVVANGRNTARDDLGTSTRWVWRMDEPMATYLALVAIGDFTFVEQSTEGGVHVLHAVPPDLAETEGAWMKLPAMIDFFDDHFGPYPFTEAGTVVLPGDLSVAMETQTRSLFGANTGDSEPTQAHELTHQWFGDNVTPGTWQDIWLNEGFATYGEWMWLEHQGGPTTAESAAQVAGSPSLDLPPGDPGVDEMFGGSVYLRGGATLQALRDRVGDDTFFNILRTWNERHRTGNADTEDFINLTNEISGQDLTPLLRTWLYQEGWPG